MPGLTAVLARLPEKGVVVKCGTQAALAIGAGYLLGRRHKTKLAAMLAAGAVTRGVSGGLGGAALRRGMKMLGSTEALQKISPQLGDIVETVRGDLLTVGKAAASAAVTSRVDSLTESLHQRAEMARNPGAAAASAGGAAREGASRAGGAAREGASSAGGAAREGAASAVRGVRRSGRMAGAREDTGQSEDEDTGSDEPRDEDMSSGEPDGAETGETRDGQRQRTEAAEEPRPARRPRRPSTSPRRTPVTRARR
jgi:hypothetical protein